MGFVGVRFLTSLKTFFEKISGNAHPGLGMVGLLVVWALALR